MNADFTKWYLRWSTWLASLALGAGSTLALYNTWPARLQTLTPDWVLMTLGGIVALSTLLIPVATSIQQKNLPPTNAGK